MLFQIKTTQFVEKFLIFNSKGKIISWWKVPLWYPLQGKLKHMIYRCPLITSDGFYEVIP